MKFKQYKDGADLSILSPKRPPAMGREGAVTSPHYLATQVGQDMLKKGGHAVDAAIATNAVLTVVYPHMSGLGGDLMAILYEEESGKIESMNGSGAAGVEATIDFYEEKGYDEIPERGPLAANTVPGTVGAWWEMHQKYGKLSWEEILEPAQRYAEEGFPMSQKFVNYLFEERELLTTYEEIERIFLKNNKELKEGAILKQKDLANTYKKIIEGGADAFYKGEIADTIVEGLQDQGGILTKTDFEKYKPDWRTPLSGEYKGTKVLQMQPNTQGLTALILLSILEQFDLNAIGDNTADYYHLMTEATKLAFIYKNRFITDMEEMEKDPESIIGPEIGEELAKEITMEKVTPEVEQPEQFPGIDKTNRDTTYFAVVDNEGNAVSMIQSVYFEFGSGFIPKGTGIILQNRGSFFELDEDNINNLEPNKRTFHTIMPGMILKDGKPLIILGTMGGEGQPQTQAALVTRILDYGYNIQEAIEAPRWLYGKTWGSESQTLKLESRISEGILAELNRRGQTVEMLGAYTDTMGHAQGIIIDPETNVLSAGADPRGDGMGLSW